MTNNIEQEFFNVFEVEPKCKRGKIVCASSANNGCAICKNNIYPEITDRNLLELICIAYSAHDIDLTIEEIKENILQNLIESKDEVKQQIQTLFKDNQ